MAHKFLLSIDGGGIRGIIPVTALAKLEQITGKPTRETFAFMAGTSTGAILTGGVAAGVPAEHILNLYLKRAHEIFPQSILNLPRRVFTGAMYSPKVLHDVIVQELDLAGDWVLNDAPIDVLVTAVRVSDGQPWYFVRDNPRNSQRTGKLKLADCVTASAAAPTYFYPWSVPDEPPPGHDPVGTLVDGGVGVTGNPVYQACVEAFYYSEGYDPEETTVVSLGTGRYAGRSNPGWIVPWLNWILGELLHSPVEQQTGLVNRHFPQTRFYRLDFEMPQEIEMDDISAIPRLYEYGQQFAAKIDWKAILDGGEAPGLITAGKTKLKQYKLDVA
jgi:hypothetical protein